VIRIRFCPVSAARARGIVAGRAKKRDNTPVKDLNDCVHLAARDLADLEEVFA
jgi:hypothetical protein